MATPPQHHDRRRGTRVWSDSDGRGSGGTIYWGAYSGRNSAGRGFVTLAESQWEDQIGPSILIQKINHTTINRRGPLNVWRIGRGIERRPCLWRRKLGRIFDQLVTERSIFMGPPARTPQRHHNQPLIGWVGAESSRGLRSGYVLWMAGGGVLRLR